MRGRMTMPFLAVLGVLLAAVPAQAREHATAAPYHGTAYHLGGASTPIDGPAPAVDELADSITEASQQTVSDIAREREKLPYGRVDGAPSSTPRVVTYPQPAGIPVSDLYAVTIGRAGLRYDSAVSTADARRPGNREEDTSWTSFSFSGAVTVAVRKLRGDATGCLVRPVSLGIRTTFAANVCTFTLKQPGNVSVEFAPNTTNPVLHPMRAPGWFQLPSVVDGVDANHGFSNVYLVDVRMGDRCLTDVSAGNLQLDPASTDQIGLLASPRCGGQA